MSSHRTLTTGLNLYNVPNETGRLARITNTQRKWGGAVKAQLGTDEPAASAAVEILDSRIEADRARLDVLCADGTYELVDVAGAQTESLRALIPSPDDDLMTDGGRWVVYPWRRKVIHLLGPRGFRRLRLDRNRNKITAAEQAHAGTLRIGVVGLSVGHAVAHTLALEGLCGQLRLADFDEIELSNLNRVPGSVFDIGINKAVVAARRIAELDPYLDVRVYEGGVEEATIDAYLDGLDVVIEECDSFDAKVLVRDRARALGIPVIMETSDGGILDVERFDLEPDRPLFHGLLGDISAASLTDLTTDQKVPFALQILDGARLTPRMAASVLEVGRTLSTWPQLGGDVALGGATVAAAVRRLVRDEALPSGRVRVDLETILDGVAEPAAVTGHRRAADPAEVGVEFAGLGDRDAVLFAGTLAPSAGNAQPWLFEPESSGVTVRLDPARTTRTDVGGRSSAVSLGAVVHNMTVAAAARGVLGTVELAEPSAHARLEFGDRTDESLSGALKPMLERSTNRSFGDGSKLTAEQMNELVADATDGTAITLVADSEALSVYASIIGAAERIRYLTPTLHQEMMADIRWPDGEFADNRRTGIDLAGLALLPQQVPLTVLLRRPDVVDHLDAWDAGTVLAADAQGRVMTGSALAIVAQRGCAGSDYVRGGMAAQALWIRAQALGLAVHPMTPIFLYANSSDELTAIAPERSDEVRALAAEFDGLTAVREGWTVTTVLRLSRAAGVPRRSVRRPVADFIG